MQAVRRRQVLARLDCAMLLEKGLPVANAIVTMIDWAIGIERPDARALAHRHADQGPRPSPPPFLNLILIRRRLVMATSLRNAILELAGRIRIARQQRHFGAGMEGKDREARR